MSTTIGSTPKVASRVVSLVTPRSKRRSLRIVASLLPPGAAIVAWAFSLSTIEIESLGDYGLPPALPPAWYASLVVLICGAIAATWVRRPNGWIIAAYVGAIVVVLYATVPAAADVPHYSWVYKHIGVAGFIDLHGSTDPDIDIYNRWPAFFAAAAAFSRLAGLPDPVSYAAWAEPMFALVCTLLVAAIARTAVPDVRVAGLAALIFALVNWVGQTYFAPQALAYTLGLALMLVVLRNMTAREAAGGRTVRLIERVTRRTQLPTLASPSLPRNRIAGVAAALALDAVIVATHQLTPYLLAVQVGALVALGLVRPRWIVLGMVALTLAYLLPNLDYVQDRYGLLNLNPTGNIERPSSNYGGSPVSGKQFNALAALLLTVALWAATAFAALRLARTGFARRALPLLVLAVTPFALVLAQSYGGEATLRLVLFTAPWCAVLIAWSITTLPRRGVRFGASFVTCAVLAALFIPAFYGQEQVNVIRAGEVQASARFYAAAPDGSVLVLAGPNFPARVSANYDRARGVRGDADPNLLRGDHFRYRPLGARDIPKVIESVRQYSQSGYLAFSTSQRRYAETLRLTPPGALEDLERAVASSPRFRLFYGNDDARIYELIEGPGS